MDSTFTDDQIDVIRADLESDFAYTKMINLVKNRFKKEGRDFNAEFEKFRVERRRGKLRDLCDQVTNQAIKIDNQRMTNIQLAAKWGITKRQASKMRKRGEL